MNQRLGNAVPATVGRRRRPVLMGVLWTAVAIGLSSCAAYRPGQGRPWPSVVFSDESAEAPAPQPKKAPALAYLEPHAFSIAEDESVVGSLGTIVLRKGDTLSDVARHFGLGYEEIVAANSDVNPWVIDDQTVAVVPLEFVLPRAPRRGIVINLAAMRLFYYPPATNGNQVTTYPVGVGKEGRSTPTGAMSIVRKAKDPTWRPTRNILNDHLKRGDPLPAVVPPGPDNPLGAYAMYLSAPKYLIHGTNKPYSVGLRASNGCIRLYPENVEALFPKVPVKAPVAIVNQPYLIGIRGGAYYLQAYRPHEELNESAARQRVREDLKKLEAEHKLSFDWGRVDRILAEARGIPFPISLQAPDVDAVIASASSLQHPTTFFGQPQQPADNPAGWHVFAAETASEISARRMVGIMHHQGPPIPARVETVGDRFRVVAGPFADAKAAQKAARRLKVDLELDSRVLAPDTALAEATPASAPVPESQAPEPPGLEMTTPDADTWESAVPQDSAPEVSIPPEVPIQDAVPIPPEAPYQDEVPPPEPAEPEQTTPETAAPDDWPVPEAPATPLEPEPSPPEITEEVLPTDGTVPSEATSPAPETTETTRSLDLSVPEGYQYQEAPEESPDSTNLEIPPEMGPPTVQPAKPAGKNSD